MLWIYSPCALDIGSVTRWCTIDILFPFKPYKFVKGDDSTSTVVSEISTNGVPDFIC